MGRGSRVGNFPDGCKLLTHYAIRSERMAATTRLAARAESIFRDLGYEVEWYGEELRATRKWRTVHVTTKSPEEAPETGEFRCFVVEADRADRPSVTVWATTSRASSTPRSSSSTTWSVEP